MSTILVLGGGGFLAGRIASHYARQGWRVISVGRSAALQPSSASDVRHVWQLPHPEFGHLLAVERPEICVNAAGQASVAASMVEPLSDFQSSTLLNFQLLEDLRRRSPSTIYIHLSSAAVYGDPVALPIGENSHLAPISPYGWHKRLSEIVIEEHARLFGMRVASLRIFSAYGPGLRRQVVWDIIRKALSKDVMSGDRPLELQGRPEDSRDFIHGDDVAGAVQAVAERGELNGEAYNGAAGVETPVREIASTILRMLGARAEIAFDRVRRSGNPSRWHANIARLRNLGFEPRTDLEQGVMQVIDAARRHHE